MTCLLDFDRRDTQIAAVKVDGRASHLLDEGARQPPGQMLAAHLIDLAREALAQLLGGGGNGVEQAHDAPQVVPFLDKLQRAAPAVQPHQLGHGDAVAQREAPYDRNLRRPLLACSMTASASGTVNCSSGSRALRMQPPGDRFDGLETQGPPPHRGSPGALASRQKPTP